MFKKKLLYLSLLFVLCSCKNQDDISKQNTSNALESTSNEVEKSSNETKSNTKETSVLSILEFNDVHGFISQDLNKAYGLSNAAYLVNQIRNKQPYDNVLLIGNGDMFQGTALVKDSYGRVMIEAMNEMGFDCLGIGNHEFDWGFEKILNYFDGDMSNGEANFPLLNANLYKNDTLLTLENGKIYESYTFDKSNIKVGVIEYIGDVSNSIDQANFVNYSIDTSYSSSVKNIATKLKDDGSDIIVVSIHGGSSSSVNNYKPNNDIAKLKYKDGTYLVDAMINGHTHTYQDGEIVRDGGLNMPIIQSRGYQNNEFYSFGQIDLTIDLSTKRAESFKIIHNDVISAGSNYDINVQNVIDTYQNAFDQNDEIYTTLLSNLPRSTDLRVQEWIGRAILKKTGADIFIMNYGGTRTTLSEGALKKSDFYSYIPFDNNIFIHMQKASAIKEFLDKESEYDFSYTRPGINLDNDEELKVACISYVYNGTYYDFVRTDPIDSSLYLRDILIDDLKARDTFDIYKDYNTVELL